MNPLVAQKMIRYLIWKKKAKFFLRKADKEYNLAQTKAEEEVERQKKLGITK